MTRAGESSRTAPDIRRPAAAAAGLFCAQSPVQPGDVVRAEPLRSDHLLT